MSVKWTPKPLHSQDLHPSRTRYRFLLSLASFVTAGFFSSFAFSLGTATVTLSRLPSSTRPAPCQYQSHGVSHRHNHQTCPLSIPVTWCITLSQSPDLPPVTASHMLYHTVTITRPAPCQCQSHGVSHHHNHETCPLSMPVTWCITPSQSPDLPPVNTSHMVYHTITITRPAPCQCQSHGVSHCHNHQTCPLSMPVTWCITPSQSPDLPPVNASHMVYHTITITRPAPCQCQSHGVSHRHNHQTCPLSMPVTWCITQSQSPYLPPVNASHMVYHTVTMPP